MMLETNKIYCGNCIDYLRELPDKCIDLCLTDPPYGVGLNYSSYDDNVDNLKSLIAEAIPEIRRVSKVALITTGVKNMFLYPSPDWTLAWISSAGVGCGPWGFACWQPILAYGKDPYLASGLGSRPDIFRSNEPSVKNGHPCPKPLELWGEVLLRGSCNEGDLILDPFMGSGTTALICKQFNRNYIGFELDPDYVMLANKRLKDTNRKLEDWF